MAQSCLLGSQIIYKASYLLTQFKGDILQIVVFQTFYFSTEIFTMLFRKSGSSYKCFYDPFAKSLK